MARFSFPETPTEPDRSWTLRRKSRRRFVVDRQTADRRETVHAERLHRHRRRVVTRHARWQFAQKWYRKLGLY